MLFRGSRGELHRSFDCILLHKGQRLAPVAERLSRDERRAVGARRVAAFPGRKSRVLAGGAVASVLLSMGWVGEEKHLLQLELQTPPPVCLYTAQAVFSGCL
jgi:hypothetical protein